MQPAKIAELLEPFLGPEDLGPNTHGLFESISTYIDILLRWNARINLTAIRDPEEIVTRHFGESLFAAHKLFPSSGNVGTVALGRPTEQRSFHHEPRLSTNDAGSSARNATEKDYRGRAALQGGDKAPEEEGASAPASSAGRHTIADLGSGAGFPGIPIKLWAPEISLTLIESNHKKATFLREIARALILTDINIQSARAETITNRFDLVTLRAVERFESILPTAAALLTPNARLALLIGKDQLQTAQRLLSTVQWADPTQIPQSRSRILLVGTLAPSEARMSHEESGQ